MNTRLYASDGISFLTLRFENDVKVNGIQTGRDAAAPSGWFENDVKVNGIQTIRWGFKNDLSLRMM